MNSEGIILLTEVTSAMLSGTTSAGGGLGMILPFVVLIAVFYFLLIRPENKKKKEAAKMRSELSVGDQITTIGGIVGTICAVKEDTIVIETSADRVRLEFTKWAISTKGTQTTENGPAEDKSKDSKK
jgi:preprotein translocase subunit YajC